MNTSAWTGRPTNDVDGVYEEDYQYRAGIFYLKIGPLKIGYDSETIRDITQNDLHRKNGWSIFPVKEDKKSHWVWEIEF